MGKLYVAGIGPGNEDGMTVKVRRILDECPVIVGYKTYIELVRPILGEDKKYVDTGMRREKERCRMALEEASAADAKVCMICSGDASVYGMAGLVLEMAEEHPPVTVEVIPGVTAALSGSAVLGAAVGHDCALISLSDLLTPREVIDKRLSTAADGDFVICLYNPESRTRKGYLKHACEIILNYRAKDTICGIVRNIGRDGEKSEVMTLEELAGYEADMFTTVFIGNSLTRAAGNRMITPRGYEL